MLNRAYHFATGGYRIISTCAIISGVAVSLTSYGAFALRSFLGPQAFHYYFGHELADMAWHATDFLSVPLLLISSQTTFLASIIPFAPAFYMPANMLFPRGDSSFLPPPLAEPVSFPPSPGLTLFMMPYVTIAYQIASSKIISWISRKTPGNPISYSRRNLIVHINRVAQEPDQNVLPNDLVLGIDNDEEGNAGPVNIAPNDNEIAVAPADNNDPGPGVVNVIHLTEGYVLRVMVSTLLSPFISPACGAVLKSISKHSSVLRTVLGIDAARGIGKLGIRSRLVTHGATLGFLAPVSLQYDVGIEDMDPVWWRNALGLSLFLLLSDATTMLHLWLALRERRSRTIMSRNFRGVDYSGLDLIVENENGNGEESE